MPTNLRLIHRLSSITKTTFALIGVGTTASFIYEWRKNKALESRSTVTDRLQKRRVLYIPFHRLKIVEHKTSNALLSSLQSLGDDKIQELTLHELINTIHEAATDPDIVTLYGTLGQGFQFQCGGYAHLEEIRNAIRVFNESHRIHEDNTRLYTSSQRHFKKYSFVFADTMDNPIDPSNKEYFLASAFSYILLQPRGNLTLYGMTTTTPFLRGFLDKYGIKVHVFKYGKYKNAPNIITEKEFTKEHYENSLSLLKSLNHSICSGIATSRHDRTWFSPAVWQLLRDYGSITANNAKEIGLVDILSNVNPLDDLIRMNQLSEDHDNRKKWLHGVDVDTFHADEIITLDTYMKLLTSRKAKEARKVQLYHWLNLASNKSNAADAMLQFLGYVGPYYNLSKHEYENMISDEVIAIVYVHGSINDTLARKTIQALQAIKYRDDIKCVILRIDSPGGSALASEAIAEECKNMKKPYICSFGNVAASGGYYIASSSSRIFALDTTITGSIGVFGVKVDLTPLMNSYNMNVKHLPSGDHGTTYSLFSPLSEEMTTNISRQLQRTYFYFKSIVSAGRKMSLDEVELIAQGRIWTGKEAKHIGLVDYIGGIHRTVAYAKNRFTTNGKANVEVWPRTPSIFESGLLLMDTSISTFAKVAPSESWRSFLTNSFQLSEHSFLTRPIDPIMMTIDENAILHSLFDNPNA